MVLVLVVMLLALLSGLVVALATLLSVESRISSNHGAGVRARAQARAALGLAVAQLQQYAGPDERVTMTAGDEVLHSQWVGVWPVEPVGGEPLVWLVSGNELDPLARRPTGMISDPEEGPDSPTVWLSSGRRAPAASRGGVKLPKEAVTAPAPGFDGVRVQGRYAFWISDEGVKLSLGLPRSDLADEGPAPPELSRHFATVPPATRRERLRSVDQASHAGFSATGSPAQLEHVTALSWRVTLGDAEARLTPFGFNVNSRAPVSVWEPVLAVGEGALPATVEGVAFDPGGFYEALVSRLAAGPRPWRRLEHVVEEAAALLPQEVPADDWMDLLRPVLGVRSDTFLVRAYGEAVNPATGAVDAVAHLEALVQREAEVYREAARGRRFMIAYLRWLAPDDV